MKETGFEHLKLQGHTMNIYIFERFFKTSKIGKAVEKIPLFPILDANASASFKIMLKRVSR